MKRKNKYGVKTKDEELKAKEERRILTLRKKLYLKDILNSKKDKNGK